MKKNSAEVSINSSETVPIKSGVLRQRVLQRVYYQVNEAMRSIPGIGGAFGKNTIYENLPSRNFNLFDNIGKQLLCFCVC